MDKLGRAARIPSESEKADMRYLDKARNYALYAEPHEVSPIIAWTLTERWTDASPYVGECVRGNATIKGIHFAVMETDGEIDGK